MSFLSNAAFLPRIWNNRNDDLQNVAGLFGSVSGTGFTPADCSPGMLCVPNGWTADGTARFTAAGAASEGDIYVCNPDDVQRVSVNGQVYAVGGIPLSAGCPAGTLCTFTKLKEGEVYAFGGGNLNAGPDEDSPYVVPYSAGVMTVTDELPEKGFYFELYAPLGTDYWTEGNTSNAVRYNLICRRVVEKEAEHGEDDT